MFRSKPIFIFILVLVLGLFIEGLKSFRDISAPNANKINTGMGNFEITPFRVSERMMKEDRERLQNDAGARMAGFRLSGRSVKADASGTSAEKKIAAQANTTEKTDPKKDAKKKKKKKSARGQGKGKTEITDQADYKKYPENQNGNKAITSPDGASAVAQFLTSTPNDQNKLPVSYEDWAKLILGRNSPDNVAKLVEFFKNGMVTSEVFYAITQAMLQESNEKQNLLAVYAVRQIHTLKSFEFLTDTLKSERQGTALAAKSSEALNEYRLPNSVGVLKAVLSAHITESHYVQLAVDLLDKSTQTYLERRDPAAATSAGGSPYDSAASSDTQNRARLNQIYGGFIPLLEVVIANYSGQDEIVEPAQAALARIKSFAAVVVAELDR
jgi:hypothetical protein